MNDTIRRTPRSFLRTAFWGPARGHIGRSRGQGFARRSQPEISAVFSVGPGDEGIEQVLVTSQMAWANSVYLCNRSEGIGPSAAASSPTIPCA
jgi:hypothetical protein